MGQSFHVGPASSIPIGQGKSFVVEGRLIAIFRRDDAFFAIADSCPHMGAPLADGYFDGSSVTCPWHAWRFCVTTGTWLDNPKSSLKAPCYKVREDKGELIIEFPDPEQSAE